MHLLLCFQFLHFITDDGYVYVIMYVRNKLGESFLDSLSVKLSFIRLFGNFSQCQVVICCILNIY